MTTLHILNASPITTSQLNSCLRVLSADDGVLLTGEAVQALRMGSAAAQQLAACERPYRLYALQEDVEARAIDTSSMSITVLDYPAFVDLCIEHARVNSWT